MIGLFSAIPLFPLLLALIWSLPWKGVALWKAARQNDVWWFVALLVLNTAGILEILYIYWFSDRATRPFVSTKKTRGND